MSGDVTGEPPGLEDQSGRRLRRSLLIGAAIMLASIYFVYANLTGNLRHVDVPPEALGNARPNKMPAAGVNILVLGLDQGADTVRNDNYTGERTDIIMLVHLSSKRNDATVISFPRDSMVRLPSCRSGEGRTGQQSHLGMINSSFNFGGIGCIWKTVETLTGIHIDHVIQVDFAGFKNMVDAIGGVDLCISEPISDKYVQLDLPAGWQRLQGEQALGFVRARHSLGDGTDIGRIQRQQAFIAAMAKKALSFEVLANPVRAFSFLNAATNSVTTDPAVTSRVMLNLALRVFSLSSGDIHFITTPWRYSAAYPGRVEWLKGSATKLFRIIAADQSLTGSRDNQVPDPVPPSTILLSPSACARNQES